MGSADNRLRRKWQDYSGDNASTAENNFFDVFQIAFDDTEYEIISKPKEFSTIYVNVELNQEVLNEIYTPDEPITKHGFSPDYSIKNNKSNKTIYVEVKRQDGWVEGLPRSAGRGNAHERSNKFFTPGLLKILRKQGNLDKNVLPFWTVFQGDITRDPCRVREITCWYADYVGNYFFWRDTRNPEKLFDHFEEHILPIIS